VYASNCAAGRIEKRWLGEDARLCTKRLAGYSCVGQVSPREQWTIQLMMKTVATMMKPVRRMRRPTRIDPAALVPAAAVALRDLVAVGSPVVVASVALRDRLLGQGDGVVSAAVGCPPRV
jgi:hypothetical protein